MRRPLLPKPVAIGLAAIVLGVAALYGRTVAFDFSYLDDDLLILQDQSFLTARGSLRASFSRPYFPTGGARDHLYYRPLVTASFALDAARGGPVPGAYHLTNVVLHAVAASLLFLLLRRGGNRDGVALLGALLFAAHPALTEAVVWIPGRNDTLLAVFALAAWLLVLDSGPGWRLREVAHLLAWGSALFTKEAALVLPLVWVVQLRWLERWPWRAILSPGRLGGWAVVLGVYLLARDGVGAGDSADGASLRPHGLGSGLSAGRLLTQAPALFASLGKLFLPVNLSVLAVPEDTWLWPAALALGALLLALRLIPGIRRPHLLFGLFCAAAFLAPGLPASHLLLLESRLYLPAVGVCWAVCEIAGRAPGSLQFRLGAASLGIATLALLTFRYSGDFRNRLTFSEAAVRQSPHSALAHRNLGVAYHLAGDHARARGQYQAALAQDAAEPVAHNNLAVILMAEGRLREAEGELRQELALNPDYAPAHRNLAMVLGATARPREEAIPHWERALQLNAADEQALDALIEHYATADPQKAAQLRTLRVGAAEPPDPAPASRR